MAIGWLFGIALQVLTWMLSLFSFLPTFTLPAPLSLVVPLPFLGSAVTGMNVWIIAAVAVSMALVLGKVLQWLYSIIPFKGT